MPRTEVEFTDEFNDWWETLSVEEQTTVAKAVVELEARGFELGSPQTSQIKGARHGHMRELRIQHAGRPFRVLYAFDSRRCAILLIGGDKTGNNRWYDEYVPLADRIYDAHIETLKLEKLKPKDR